MTIFVGWRGGLFSEYGDGVHLCGFSGGYESGEECDGGGEEDSLCEFEGFESDGEVSYVAADIYFLEYVDEDGGEEHAD